MREKLLNYIENSFLNELLKKNTITDISFNGENIFYQDNNLGRRKSNLKISLNDASDFIRQIANLSESQFSYASPVLDISVGRYRINATHGAITKFNNEKSLSFSIRIASLSPRIKNPSDFLSSEGFTFLDRVIKNNISVVIGGKTGTGKTELQKYLLSLVNTYGRIIAIDNVSELESLRVNKDLDLTYWQVNKDIKHGGFDDLIKNAVRNNPDWLVVAEARGEEMSSVINSAMSGHPIITTIHSKDVESMPYRMARMALINNKQEIFEDIIYTIKTHFPIYIYLGKKIVDGTIKRYVEAIGEYHNDKMNVIYDVSNGFNLKKLSKELKKELGYE